MKKAEVTPRKTYLTKNITLVLTLGFNACLGTHRSHLVRPRVRKVEFYRSFTKLSFFLHLKHPLESVGTCSYTNLNY